MVRSDYMALFYGSVSHQEMFIPMWDVYYKLLKIV
jgi:hypothetical protein